MDLREVTEFIKDFMWYIIVFLVIGLILIFVVAFQTVAGNSMNPTLKDGQIVLVSKLPFKIERNQIVLFNSDGNVATCTGLGYKIFNYRRTSFSGDEYGPFWATDRTAEK